LHEATRALNSEQYADLLKAILYLETNFQLQRSLYDTFPGISRERRTDDIYAELTARSTRDQRFFVVQVESFGKSRGLIELITHPYSANHNVRRSLVRAFPGQTVCVAVIFKRSGRNRRSRLTFMVCRSISHQSANMDTIDVENNAPLDDVSIKLTASRYHLVPARRSW